MAVLLVENAAVLAITPKQSAVPPPLAGALAREQWHGDVGLMTEHVEQDLGARLRSAREQAGLSLRQIADTTKLAVYTLEALENNRIDRLPGGIYRRAIVRAYAAEVGLDPEETLRSFLAHYPDDVPSAAALVAETPAERPIRRALRTILSVLGAIVPLAAGGLYFSSSLADTASNAPPAIIDILPASEPGTPELRRASVTLPPLGPIAMLISISADTHLQIVADGRDVMARRLSAGDIIRLDIADEVVLLGDNAGAVHFSLNGRAARTLGEEGEPLSARIARDNYQAWLIQP